MSNAKNALKMGFKSRRSAPGHPVKFLTHRSSCDVGPYYRNIAEWQIDKSKTLYRKNLIAHFGCVNAIEFSKDGRLLVSGGDDRRVLLWDVDKAIRGKQEPKVMQAEHLSNVFSLDFSCSLEKIISAGNDDNVILHDIATGAPLDYFVHEQPVYGVSADPVNESVFCSACDDGRILIFDIRESGNDPFCLAKVHSSFHSVMFHPVEPRLVVTANSKEGVASWDVRMPKRVLLKYGMQNSNQCCMSARFNRTGSQILVLRRRLPPILYATDSPYHLFQFNHRGYYNSCTMKSCSFAGLDDQYVLSGSDNFDLHLWKIPPPGSDQWVNKADMVLRGHRSIVNQVRYNYVHNVIASSGVEKIVKLWSPFPLPDEAGGKVPAVLTSDSERQIYTPDDYVSLVMQTGQGPGQFMSLTFEAGRRTTREDSRMLAFFDALVQRDINGFSDDDSDNFPETSYTNTVYSTPASSSSENEDEDSNPPNYRSLLTTTTGTSTDSTVFPARVSESPNATDEPSNRNDVSTDQDQATTSSSPVASRSNPEGEPLNETDSVDDNDAVVMRLERVHNDVDDEDDLYVDDDDDLNEQTEDRDMTANMITQLILEKEDSRRKQKSKRGGNSNSGTASGNGNEQQDDSEDNSSSDDHASSTSRPLCLAKKKARSSTRSNEASSSKSHNHFRKQLLNARRREMMSSTPVYESSRNSTTTSASTYSEMSLERINELMTRNQYNTNESESSAESSSSSSSESSTSDAEDGESNDQSSTKNLKKVIKNSAKPSSRSCVVVSSDTSSSECESKASDVKKSAIERDSGGTRSEPSTSAVNASKDLKRKRRPRCKLNEACQAYFKKLLGSESDSRRDSEDTSCVSPAKRTRIDNVDLESHAMPSSTESKVEPVVFKRLAKHKDRIYRKSAAESGGCTPPDSGIDVSKEPEPCCSKSFKDNQTKVKTNASEEDDEVSTSTVVANKDTSASSPSSAGTANEVCESETEDPGFGQVDSETESD